MVLDKDFKEFIALLNENNVRYLVVGGYAVAFHGHPRYTKDLDVWVEVASDNAEKISDVVQKFGFVSLGLESSDFLEPDSFVQLGYPPHRIDIIMGCEGLTFSDCYPKRQIIEIEGLNIFFLDLDSLLLNKETVGRPQDLADVSTLVSKNNN
jgi:hypothetical protein